MVQYLELDATEVDGNPFGFLESSTKFQETGASALKRSMEMPLVGPVLGCTHVEWRHKWLEIMIVFGFDMAARPFGPICRAPRGDNEF